MCGLDLVVVVILCLEIIKKKKMENNLWFNQSGAQNSTELWFNQSGDAVITVGGDNKWTERQTETTPSPICPPGPALVILTVCE